MDSQFFKTLPRRTQWRSAAPRARASRIASFKSVLAFLVDQILLFWPPYRHEHDCDSRQPGGRPQDQDNPSD
jgi:hypothetical protein